MFPFRQIYFALALLVFVTLVGMSGYMYLEGFRVLDAFYMTIITISTAGFQEVHPLSDNGKIFTAFLIITSFGTFAYALTAISKYVVDGEFNNYLKNYRVTSEIEKLQGHVIICGYGRNGKQAAHILKRHNLSRQSFSTLCSFLVYFRNTFSFFAYFSNFCTLIRHFGRSL